MFLTILGWAILVIALFELMVVMVADGVSEGKRIYMFFTQMNIIIYVVFNLYY